MVNNYLNTRGIMVTNTFAYSRNAARRGGVGELPQAASEQEQTAKPAETSKTTPAAPKADAAQRKPKVTEKGEQLKKDLDKIIDEIDDVLEENAEEFIRSYVQRGGE